MAVVQGELCYLDENGEVKSTSIVYGLHNGVVKPMQIWTYGENQIGGEVWDDVGLVADNVGEQWEIRTLPEYVMINYYIVAQIGNDPDLTVLYDTEEVVAGAKHVISNYPSLEQFNQDLSQSFRIREVDGWFLDSKVGGRWEAGSTQVINETVNLYCYAIGYYKG